MTKMKDFEYDLSEESIDMPVKKPRKKKMEA